MAVKVMLAPAVARRATTPEAEKPAPPGPAEQKRKRRRSSVYDAEGNEVFLTLMCLKCHKMRPLSQFGLRRMADGAIRNQPWCRTCRSGGASVEAPRRRRATDENGKLPSEGTPPEKVVDSGILAAQVVAALNGGRR